MALSAVKFGAVTGAEIAAAGKALEIVGKKSLDHDDKTADVLLDAAKDTAEMKAAARTMAARIAVKERVKLRLYQPFARMLGVSKVYFEDVFPEEMATKTAHIPDEHMITPLPSVAVPALQGLSYTFDESDLRELYLNLLATASDDRKSGLAHPAFAETIKQLSAAEARFLNLVIAEDNHAIVLIKNHHDEGSRYDVLMRHLLNVGSYEGDAIPSSIDVSMWVDNWIRLGLFEVTYTHFLSNSDSDEDEYAWVAENEVYRTFEASGKVKRISFDKGILFRTNFGDRFHLAITPPTGQRSERLDTALNDDPSVQQ